MGRMTLMGCGRAPAASSDAAQTTAFLARTSGLSGTEIAAYKAMINGMVSDGVWSKLDALYIFATKDKTTASLNLISTSYGLTEIGTGGALTFTADQGYTGIFDSCLDTGLVLTSATKYGLNSAAMGCYVLNNRTTGAQYILFGSDASDYSYMRPLNSGGNTEFDLNDSDFSTASATTTQGSWFINRSAGSGAGALTLYRNGSSVSASSSAATSIPATNSVYILALNNAGTINSPAVNDQLSAFWVGGGFSATDMANFSTRLNAYMTALGVNVY